MQVRLLRVFVLAQGLLLLVQLCVELSDALVVAGLLAQVEHLGLQFRNLKVFIVILGSPV